MHRRRMLMLMAASGVSACADRLHTPLRPQAASVGTLRPVYVATNRVPDPGGWFTTERSEGMNYLKLGVSIPPAHERGALRNGHANPDPRTDFAIASREDLETSAGFRAALAGAIRSAPPDEREIAVYVHGYNNSFFDGVYRTAQIIHDFDVPATAVHFSWPSATHPLGYAYDRDSILISRDALERLLRDLRRSGSRRIVLIAHSLGSMLVMETLRQIEIADPGWAKRSLGGVVLISPDLDIELFRRQAHRFRGLPQPFAIITSNRDRALALSARINGAAARLGNLTDAEALGDFPVTIVDVSKFRARGTGHFTIGTSPALISLISNSAMLGAAFQTDRSARSGLLPGTVLTVRNATQMILSPDLLLTQM